MFENLKKYRQGILDSFRVYDEFLAKFISGSKTYNALFSIRTSYAVHSEMERLTGQSRLDFCKTVLIVIYQLFNLIFYKVHISNHGKVVLLKYSQLDEEIATSLGAQCASIVKKRNFALSRIRHWPFIVRLVYLLLADKSLNKHYALKNLKRLIFYVSTYHDIDLKQIKIIITENDVWPEYVAIIHKAIHNGVKTIKIENSLIDNIQHNNVLCEYYYYPSEFHKYIREQFVINEKLKYIKGGFLNFDKLSRYNGCEPEIKTVIYLTCGVNFYGKYGDHYYIDEILSVLPSDYLLTIKIHPRDELRFYEKYQSNRNCILIKKTEENIYDVISNNGICISILSSLSLEAKLIHENAYFINYWSTEDLNIIDYPFFKMFFNVIDNKEQLIEIISGNFKPTRLDDFLKKYNMTFPDTMDHFKEVLDSL